MVPLSKIRLLGQKYIDKLSDEFLAANKANIEAGEITESAISYLFDDVLRLRLTDLIFDLNHRIDGRKFDKVREITNEVGLLPFAHGSALFKRGRTQALVSVTLGGGQDEQRVEELVRRS